MGNPERGPVEYASIAVGVTMAMLREDIAGARLLLGDLNLEETREAYIVLIGMFEGALAFSLPYTGFSSVEEMLQNIARDHAAGEL